MSVLVSRDSKVILQGLNTTLGKSLLVSIDRKSVNLVGGVLPGEEGYRYFEELQHKFVNPLRVGAYVIAFILLGLHLAHGFQSAFQSIGFNNKYTKFVKNLGTFYSIVVPLGFIIIALCHHFNH